MPDGAIAELEADAQAVVDSAAQQITEMLGPSVDTTAGAQLAAQIGGTLSALVAPMQAAHASQMAALHETVATVSAQIAAGPPRAPREAADIDDILNIDAHAYNPHAVGAALDDGRFASFSAFARSVIAMRSGRVDDRLALVPESGDIQADLSGEELPDGGALVPEQFRARLMQLMVQGPSIRSRAMILPMGSSTLTVPYVRDVSHAGGQLYGGVLTHWLEAGADVPESQPSFAQVRLTAKALAALTEIQNTTIADSFTSVPALIATMFAEALRWREEMEFIRGNGSGRPLGILNSNALVEVAADTDTPGNVVADDIHAMEGRLMPGSDERAVWMIHPALRTDLGRLNLGGVQYWQEDLTARRPMTLNGRPVITCEHCSAPGTTGDIILVDWSYYLVGDRQALSLSTSTHAEFRRNATLVRAIERIDGQPWIDSALTLAQGGADTAVSPFVVLNSTRS